MNAEKVCPLLLLRKQVVKSVQSLQQMVARKGPIIDPRDRRQTQTSRVILPQVLLRLLKTTLELETIHAIRPTHGEARHDDAYDRRVGRQTVLWLPPLRHPWTATTSNSSTNPMYTQTVAKVQHTRSADAAALLPRQSIIVTVANHGRRRKSR
jgi:hypothetical protein